MEEKFTRQKAQALIELCKLFEDEIAKSALIGLSEKEKDWIRAMTPGLVDLLIFEAAPAFKPYSSKRVKGLQEHQRRHFLVYLSRLQEVANVINASLMGTGKTLDGVGAAAIARNLSYFDVLLGKPDSKVVVLAALLLMEQWRREIKGASSMVALVLKDSPLEMAIQLRDDNLELFARMRELCTSITAFLSPDKPATKAATETGAGATTEAGAVAAATTAFLKKWEWKQLGASQLVHVVRRYSTLGDLAKPPSPKEAHKPQPPKEGEAPEPQPPEEDEPPPLAEDVDPQPKDAVKPVPVEKESPPGLSEKDDDAEPVPVEKESPPDLGEEDDDAEPLPGALHKLLAEIQRELTEEGKASAPVVEKMTAWLERWEKLSPRVLEGLDRLEQQQRGAFENFKQHYDKVWAAYDKVKSAFKSLKSETNPVPKDQELRRALVDGKIKSKIKGKSVDVDFPYYDVILANKEKMGDFEHIHIKLLMPDEAHDYNKMSKSEKTSETTAMASRLAALIAKAECTFPLTGSPNRLGPFDVVDIVAAQHALFCGQLLAVLVEHAAKFGVDGKDGSGQTRSLKALLEDIVEPALTLRDKTDPLMRMATQAAGKLVLRFYDLVMFRDEGPLSADARAAAAAEARIPPSALQFVTIVAPKHVQELNERSVGSRHATNTVARAQANSLDVFADRVTHLQSQYKAQILSLKEVQEAVLVELALCPKAELALLLLKLRRAMGSNGALVYFTLVEHVEAFAFTCQVLGFLTHMYFADTPAEDKATVENLVGDMERKDFRVVVVTIAGFDQGVDARAMDTLILFDVVWVMASSRQIYARVRRIGGRNSFIFVLRYHGGYDEAADVKSLERLVNVQKVTLDRSLAHKMLADPEMLLREFEKADQLPFVRTRDAAAAHERDQFKFADAKAYSSYMPLYAERVMAHGELCNAEEDRRRLVDEYAAFHPRKPSVKDADDATLARCLMELPLAQRQRLIAAHREVKRLRAKVAQVEARERAYVYAPGAKPDYGLELPTTLPNT